MQSVPDYATLPGRMVTMPDTETKSTFDLAEDAHLDAQAEAEIDSGKGIPHEKMRDWLAKLGKGEKVPPPIA